jgi:hypothetical protein
LPYYLLLDLLRLLLKISLSVIHLIQIQQIPNLIFLLLPSLALFLFYLLRLTTLKARSPEITPSASFKTTLLLRLSLMLILLTLLGPDIILFILINTALLQAFLVITHNLL